MANAIVQAITLAAGDDDGICQSQSPAAAGDLTINGALATAGVATLTSAGASRPVIVTSGGNDTGRTFTLYGTNAQGGYQSESFAGASGGAATSALYYRSITRVAISGASAGTVTVGTTDVGATRIINVDTVLNPINIFVGCVVSGTVNYTLQWTVSDIQTPASITWNNDANLVNATGSGNSSYTLPITGLRVLINSGTGTVTTTVQQSGLGS